MKKLALAVGLIIVSLGTLTTVLFLRKYSSIEEIKIEEKTEESVLQAGLLERLTPQIVAVLVPNELGGIGEPMVKEVKACRPEIDAGCNLEEELLGISVATRYKTTLASSMTSVQTTVPVSSILSFDNQTLSMDTLGPAVYLTIEPGTTREEIVKCADIASSQWASCTRGLQFYGTSETASTTLQKTHNSGTIVIMSNVHYVYENLVDKDASESIGGNKTFTSGTVFFTNSSYGIRASTTAGALQWSINGFTDSYNFTSSSISTLTASSTRAIGVTNSEIHVNASATSSLNFEGESGRLIVRASSTAGMAVDEQGVYLVIPATSSLKFDGNRLNLWVSSTNAIAQDTNGLYLVVPSTSSLKIDGSRLNLWVSPTGGILQDTNGIYLDVSATSSVKIDGNRLVLWASSTAGIAQDTNGLYIDVTDSLVWSASTTFSGQVGMGTVITNSSSIAHANLLDLTIDGYTADALVNGTNADALHILSYSNLIFGSTADVEIISDLSEIAIFATTTVAANTLTPTSTLHYVLDLTDFRLQPGATADLVTFRARYGGSIISSVSLQNDDAADWNGDGRIEGFIYASTTSAQEGTMTVDIYQDGLVKSVTSTKSGYGFGTTAIDATAAQGFEITADFLSADGNSIVAARRGFVEIIQ